MFAKQRIVLVGLLALTLCASAFAQKTETIENGRTSVALSGDLVNALTSLGVAPGTVAPSRLHNGTVGFPVTGGAIDLKTLKAQILHSGGLTLTAGSTSVRLQAFIIDTTGSAPVITGLVVVNGALLGRLPLFDVSLANAKISVGDDDLKISGVGLTLDQTAATALNQVFGVTAFKAGFPVGTAAVKAELSAGWDKDRD